ncbi:MAG: DUF488 domain-containing protein [Archaeoglobaceae archaeon]|nr:DUF488 domain-containing protein [Archaeoglobaceae archaeon]MDW8128448.1 DUF488 domain-containing protein [Archaeoglobaceae archaeon]
MKIYTIGHSNLTFETFLNLLAKNGIEVIVDVRKIPRSKFEHFNSDFLKVELPKAGIDYVHAVKLGGFRKKIFEKSPNNAIKSQGFRNYADFMLTEEFEKEIDKVIEIAKKRILALMCAEKFFWKCHRKFLADYLTLRGFKVFHIIGNRTQLHRLSKSVRIYGNKLIYDIEI